jgi:hypothetical protein
MLGLWKMTRLWKSAKSADSHEPLGKVFAKNASTFPHFPQALLVLIFFGDKRKANEWDREPKYRITKRRNLDPAMLVWEIPNPRK